MKQLPFPVTSPNHVYRPVDQWPWHSNHWGSGTVSRRGLTLVTSTDGMDLVQRPKQWFLRNDQKKILCSWKKTIRSILKNFSLDSFLSSGHHKVSGKVLVTVMLVIFILIIFMLVAMLCVWTEYCDFDAFTAFFLVLVSVEFVLLLLKYLSLSRHKRQQTKLTTHLWVHPNPRRTLTHQ